MSNVDKRVVKMEFDNQQFEKGIKTSTDSLDSLKKGLNLDESAKSLNNLDKAGKNFSLAGIAAGVDTLVNRFSTLGIIGITALQNITNSVINTGAQMAKSLTIDPIMQGFKEYEAGLTAFQTIMANTKAPVDQINKTLAELNVYANKTIYSFGDMTTAIGLFTAQGVNLKDSTTAIKGIFNIVSLTGGNAEKANSAIYQLSQAIASGTVKAQDWISVVNAGIGGTEFQEQLKQTSRVLNTGVDAAIKKQGSFKDSLTEGWLTSKVLLQTLTTYTGDLSDAQLKSLGYSAEQIKQIQILAKTANDSATKIKTFTQLMDTLSSNVVTGWATTFKTVIGDLNNASALWTGVGDSIGGMLQASSDARNKMLTDWAGFGGREAIIKGLSNVFQSLLNILKPISKAFEEIFPPMTGKQLADISKGFEHLTEILKIGGKTSDNIKNTFKGLFAVLDVGVTIFKLLAGGLALFINALIPGSGIMSNSFLELTGKIGNHLVALDDLIKKSNFVNIALEKMGGAFKVVSDYIKQGLTDINPLLEWAKSTLSKIGDTFLGFFDGSKVMAAGLDVTKTAVTTTAPAIDTLKRAFDGIVGVFKTVGEGIAFIAITVKNVLSPIVDSLKKKFDTFTLKDLAAVLTGVGLIKFAEALKNITSVVSSFTGIMDQVSATLKAFQLKVKADALLKVAIALGILAVALILMSFIKIEDLAKSLGILTVVFIELVGALVILNKFVKDIKKITGQLVALSFGLLLLAVSIKILASLDFAKLAQGTGAIAVLMTVIALFIKITKGGELTKSAGGLTAFAFGLVILSGALAILASISRDKLIQGTIAISTLMAVIIVFIKAVKGGDLKDSAGGLMGFATGILILTGALAILASISQDKLIQGGVAIATMMVVISEFIKVTKGGDLAKSAGGLMGFAMGLMILVGSLVLLSNIDPLKLIQGGAAIFALLEVISLFIKSVENGDLIKSAGGLSAFAVGLVILTGALVILSKLEPLRLMQGVAAIAALVSVISVFINSTNEGDLKSSSKGLIGFSIGLMALSAAVAILAAIDPKRIVQGVVALSTLMIVIGVFVSVTKGGDLKKSSVGLIGFCTGLLILAGTIAILSALDPQKLMNASVALSSLIVVITLFVKLTSVGDLLLSAAGLIVFSGAIYILGQALISIGSVNSMTLIKGVVTLAAALLILTLTSVAISEFILPLLALAAALVLFGLAALEVGAGMLLFATGLDILSKSGSAGVANLSIVVTTLIGLIPLALTALAIGLINFAQAIGNGAPVIATAMTQVLLGMITVIIAITPQIMLCLATLLVALLTTLAQYVPPMVDAGMRLIIGILQGIAAHVQQVVEAGINVILNFINGVISKLPAIVDTAFRLIITFINSMADAIRNNHNAIYDASANLINAVVGALLDLGSRMTSVGQNVIDGFIQGIKSMAWKAASAAMNVAWGVVEAVKNLLGIHSPSTVFADMGMNSDKGLANGFIKYSKLASNAATNVGNSTMKSLSNAISNISDLVSGSIDSTPTIRPVLDLSDVQNGSKKLYGIMDNLDGYDISSSVNLANTTAKNFKKNKVTENNPTDTPGKDNPSTSENNNTFYITSTDPKSAATEVADILQKQVERRDAVWGL